jgi:quinol monooxygenase YgiN
MPVRLVVTFNILPGRADEFIGAWPERLAEVHEEPGCEQYELFRSVDRPDVVVLLELWTSVETLQAHGEMNQKRTPIGRELLDGRPVLERFET